MNNLGNLMAGYFNARDILITIADEFQNNYLTRERFAECNGLTLQHAELLINLAQEVRKTPSPDA